jgi:hypothetical protein
MEELFCPFASLPCGHTFGATWVRKTLVIQHLLQEHHHLRNIRCLVPGCVGFESEFLTDITAEHVYSHWTCTAYLDHPPTQFSFDLSTADAAPEIPSREGSKRTRETPTQEEPSLVPDDLDAGLDNFPLAGDLEDESTPRDFGPFEAPKFVAFNELSDRQKIEIDYLLFLVEDSMTHASYKRSLGTRLFQQYIPSDALPQSIATLKRRLWDLVRNVFRVQKGFAIYK